MGESKRYAATYEGMQFFLEIAETAGPESYFQFLVNPLAAFGETKTVVQMVRTRDPTIEPPVATEMRDTIGAA